MAILATYHIGVLALTKSIIWTICFLQPYKYGKSATLEKARCALRGTVYGMVSIKKIHKQIYIDKDSFKAKWYTGGIVLANNLPVQENPEHRQKNTALKQDLQLLNRTHRHLKQDFASSKQHIQPLLSSLWVHFSDQIKFIYSPLLNRSDNAAWYPLFRTDSVI